MPMMTCAHRLGALGGSSMRSSVRSRGARGEDVFNAPVIDASPAIGEGALGSIASIDNAGDAGGVVGCPRSVCFLFATSALAGFGA